MKRNSRFIVKLGLALMLIVVGLSNVCGADVPREVEQLVLEQKWEQVRGVLTVDDSKASDPVARLLVAHASLATNRNNEAMLLFLSLREPDAANACVNWAQQFTKNHSDSAVAHYLMGDALARAGQLKEALTSFYRALKIDSNDVLALNACGVASAVNGNLDGALEILAKATTLRPDFADAHANLGALWVMLRVSSGAKTSFDRALAITPDFILARHGQACVLTVQEEWDKAEALFEQCFAYPPIAELAARNFSDLKNLQMAAIVSEMGDTSASGEPPGTTIEVRSDVRSLANRMNAELATKTPEQAAFYIQDMTKQYGVNVVAQATQIVNNDIVTQVKSLNIQSNQVYRDCQDHLNRFAINKGWGDTLNAWDEYVIKPLIAGTPYRRDAASLATTEVSIGLSQVGRGLNENAAFEARQVDQGMTFLKSNSREAARLGAINMQIDTHFGAPDKWGYNKVFSMDKTNNRGLDLTTASTMAGNIPKNLTGQVYIVSQDRSLADTMVGTLTKEKGIPQQNIHILPSSDLNFAKGFNQNRDYVLNVRTSAPPAGVTSKPKKSGTDTGKWLITTTFGLLYPVPESLEGGTR
ncbi:tetratricopeptide repeat protein [Candidatus Poribacteria bacterium]|nr:tetratricopeptide repeat protein [Candidatus Poribacteria bacterium]